MGWGWGLHGTVANLATAPILAGDCVIFWGVRLPTGCKVLVIGWADMSSWLLSASWGSVGAAWHGFGGVGLSSVG